MRLELSEVVMTAKNSDDQAKLLAAVESGAIHEWLTSCGAATHCLQCSGEEWAVLIDEKSTSGLIIIENDSISLSKYVPLMSMVCVKCGFLRTHSANHFLKWQQSKGGGDG